MGLTAIIVNRT